MDNYAAFSEKRYQMICQIQNFLKEGCSYREIAKRMGIGRNTIAKYRKGDPKELSIYGIHQSKLDPFHDFIIDCLKEGWSKSKTVKQYTKKDILAPKAMLATVYKGNIIKNLIMDCQSYTKYRPNETTGGIFVSWRRKEELPTGA